MKCFEDAGHIVPFSSGHLEDILAEVERKIIIEELKHCRGNMAKAARILGITERMMRLRVAKYKINPAELKRLSASYSQKE